MLPPRMIVVQALGMSVAMILLAAVVFVAAVILLASAVLLIFVAVDVVIDQARSWPAHDRRDGK